QLEKPRHERDLIEADAQKPQRELDERALREIAAAVEIALPRRIGEVHHLLVLAAALETAGQPARDRPEPMRADAGEMRHGVTHQSADAPITVGKGVDVVEAMMGGCHRHHAAGLAQAIKAITRFKIDHEVSDTIA